MKKRRIGLALCSVLLVFVILAGTVGCTLRVSAENLMDGVTPNRVLGLDDLTSGNIAASDFAVRLFAAGFSDDTNTLISPLSVLSALAMTANGAEGETLAEMEAALGMSRTNLNLYLYSYIGSLPRAEKYRISIANSIWFTDDDKFTVNSDFLQKNADYFGADIYKTAFNNRTKSDINNWVRNKTDGMIPKILDSIPEDAIMYLVNALAFEAEWMSIYEKSQVRDGTFTTESGEVRDVEMMYSTEGKYLQDELATGFIKYYSGGKYAFAALLPNEGVTVGEYIASLDGESLNSMLGGAEYDSVKTRMPKFEVEYDIEMSDVLISMGMSDAFDWRFADFGSIGSHEDGNIFIKKVLHKTHISVGERGTKAGAVTVINMNAGSAGPPEDPKEVYLDRPFVYMLIDCENNVPFFIGALMDTK